jgi:UDP-N-acetylglucosamine 2-epimerase
MSLPRKTIVTITGIRPDFIRMSQVFKRLDEHFNHILVHTGQHYDTMLSGVFFKELGIRNPDYILNTGKEASNHYEQLSYLSTAIPKLFLEQNLTPDLVLFLGDSNSAGVAFPLKKEGYKIGHIEAGMRSYDKRMLEEMNRIVCDHCSDILFVYHEDYAAQIAQEGITQNVFVVGNTIVEPFKQFQSTIMTETKRRDMILMDIHRPENFKYVDRLRSIIEFGNRCIEKYNLPVKLLYFKRLQDMIDQHGISLGKIQMVPLMSFQDYLTSVYHSRFIISDSGTGQEEPGLLQTPTIVPRDFTERPQSFLLNCSKKFTAESPNDEEVFTWLSQLENGVITMDVSWLGSGDTSHQIVHHLRHFLSA